MHDLLKADTRESIPIHEEWKKISVACCEVGPEKVAKILGRSLGCIHGIWKTMNMLDINVVSLMEKETLTRSQLYLIARLQLKDQYSVADLSQNRSFQFTRNLCKLIKDSYDPS